MLFVCVCICVFHQSIKIQSNKNKKIKTTIYIYILEWNPVYNLSKWSMMCLCTLLNLTGATLRDIYKLLDYIIHIYIYVCVCVCNK